ncbi:MAG: apolipoprotein N-acyltransferase [Alphaproteobacteria bacterium]|nr:apolipoprotein N-acyltransferase [Alphaproteobacteria bacterium]
MRMTKPVFLYLFLAGLGGVSALAFAPYNWAPILFATLGYLFYRLNAATAFKKAFCAGFWFGFGMGAVSLSWLSHALMIDGGRFGWLIPFALGGMGLVFGAFWGVPAGLAVYFPAGFRRLAAWTALIVGFEWVRSWIFTGFPWNLMGTAWARYPELIQSAALWGVYGVSFCVVFLHALPGLWPRRKPILHALAGIMLLYGAGAWRLYDARGDVVLGVHLRIVQPNIPQTLKWDKESGEKHYARLLALSRDNNAGITHVVWPESAVQFFVNTDEAQRLRMMSAVRQGGTLITGGMRADMATRQVANSIFILDDMADIVGFYDKSHLVPFGEYTPMRGILPFDKIVPFETDFVEGNGIATLHVPKAPPVSPLVCYEIIFPGRVARKNPRPGWIVNVTNDGWYGVSAGPHQHLAAARMRAVEEGLPVVRAANTGISAVIDPHGRIVARLELDTAGVLDADLPQPLAPTPYAGGGDGIPLGLCALVLLAARRRKKARL